ncbi:MAG: DegT/DnrJ/EryC1/StrS aminotransferase family protein, partial [Clostridiales bacterium]|nr:DegT/DnrJ/EryC1/StrS aminotransferase family protein [Clostridiales bacterium]
MSQFKKREKFIPYNLPDITDAEINEVVDTMRSGWVAKGPRTNEFEKRFAEYLGAKHAVAMNSCTAALHVALLTQGIGPGDEVITTPMT